MSRTFILTLVLIAAVMPGCTCASMTVSDSDAVRAAETHGFTSVRIVERHNAFMEWNGCGEDDAVAFEMQGTNAAGRTVDFTVCCGGGVISSKGCTLRVR